MCNKVIQEKQKSCHIINLYGTVMHQYLQKLIEIVFTERHKGLLLKSFWDIKDDHYHRSFVGCDL